MGQCLSNPHEGPWKSWICLCSALHISYPDFKALFRIFTRLDRDHSGTIDVDDLIVYLRVKNNPFLRRVFLLFDLDHTSNLDFGQFVLAMWNYCINPQSTLLYFSFQIYDLDEDGILSKEDARRMFLEIYGANDKVNEYMKKLDSLLGGIEGSTVSFTGLQTLSLTYPSLLLPAYNLQVLIQRRLLGEVMWKYLKDLPVQLPNGNKLSILEFKTKVSVLNHK